MCNLSQISSPKVYKKKKRIYQIMILLRIFWITQTKKIPCKGIFLGCKALENLLTFKQNMSPLEVLWKMLELTAAITLFLPLLDGF